jgi:hypothetical protein
MKSEMNKRTVHSRTPPRNRLAKVLPEEWRQVILEQGAPKRKYTAVVRATMANGRVIADMIIEEGWIIALSKAGLAGMFEERIDLDPRFIEAIEVKQVV